LNVKAIRLRNGFYFLNPVRHFTTGQVLWRHAFFTTHRPGGSVPGKGTKYHEGRALRFAFVPLRVISTLLNASLRGEDFEFCPVANSSLH
jgi:hypothetical protein